ncbi:MAG: hypothetical protein ABTD50_00825 [Polyangiaceae bacterium]
MNSVGSSSIRTDVVGVETTPRPTATPPRVQFSEVLSGGAQALVSGAQAALRTLPGAPLMAVAVRSGTATLPAVSSGVGTAGFQALTPHAAITVATPEGPGGSSSGIPTVSVGASTSSGTSDGSLEGSIAQEQQMNLYYLQIQEEVNAQNRTFSALSNVLEVEHNTAKTAIGNIH